MQALEFQFREEAVLQTLTEDVLKSSEIEGEILDKDQVRSSIARRLGLSSGTNQKTLAKWKRTGPGKWSFCLTVGTTARRLHGQGNWFSQSHERYCWRRVVRNPARPCLSIERCHVRYSSTVRR